MPSLLRRLSSGFLLRELEERSAARAETERASEARRVALASARLDAAMLLASKGSLAEADLLLRAAGSALEGGEEAAAAEGGEPERPSDDLSAEAFRERLDALTRRLVEESRAALTPAAIRKVRRRRIGGLAFAASVGALGVVLLLRGPRGLAAAASASWGDGYAAKEAIDGLARTEWLLPDGTPGWLEVRLVRPRKVSRIRILNARNLPHADRSTHQFHIDAFHGPRLVKRIDGTFPGFQQRPTWQTHVVGETVDRFRIEVRTWHLSGGGFGEIEVD